MKTNPDIDSIYSRGLDALTEERFDEALELLGRLPAMNVTDPVMLNDLALARMAAGQADSAMSLFEELLQGPSPHPFVRINFHFCRQVLELPPLAVQDPARRVRKLARKEEGKPPKVSVIMATYNRPRMISESLESVIAQTYPDFELLIVNDGGDEAVEGVLADYSDPRLVYVLAEHGGLSSALNVGLSQARGEWIAYLDDDDIFYPYHLETLVDYLDSSGGAPAAYTDMYRAYQIKEGDHYRVVKRVLDYGLDLDRAKLRAQSQIPNRNPLMHHRRCTDGMGGYNEGLNYTMDWDFCLRLSKRFDVHHIKKVTGEFRTRSDASQMTATKGAERNLCRNLILYLNGISPLTGRLLRSASQGDGEKLANELGRIMEMREGIINEIEFRKLWQEPFYALFYALGKLRMEAGGRAEARAAFSAARRLSPFEPRAIIAWLRSRI